MKAPVPCTEAVHWLVWPVVCTVAGLQVAVTLVMVGGAGVTVTLAVPDFVLSCTEVAVTVTFPAVAGAVRSPDELIVPALADQVTEGL